MTTNEHSMEEPIPFRRKWIQNNRHASSSQILNTDKFSVMTYNILNDDYIEEDYKYCPEEYRYMPYRLKLIVNEIKLYAPHIICLQEVQREIYAEMLGGHLESLGYEGSFHPYSGPNPPQANALFYRQDSFTLDDVKSFRFLELASEEFRLSGLDAKTIESFSQRMNNPKGMVIATLRHKKTGKNLHLVNLHLLWDLQKADVQTLQICSTIRFLQKYMTNLDNPAYIITGDFNTPPTFPAYQMMEQTGPPNSDNIKFLQKSTFTQPNGKDEAMVNIIPQLFYTDLDLVSAYKHIMGAEPMMTSNWDQGSLLQPLILDYMWFGPNALNVSSILKIPSTEDINRHVGIPSVQFPSDHLHLMSEFTFS